MGDATNRTAESGIRWTPFKIIMTIILLGLAGFVCYTGISPMLEGDYSFKSWVNVLFVVLLLSFLISLFKVGSSSQFVSWACGFGLMIFACAMFVNYESIFE